MHIQSRLLWSSRMEKWLHYWFLSTILFKEFGPLIQVVQVKPIDASLYLDHLHLQLMMWIMENRLVTKLTWEWDCFIILLFMVQIPWKELLIRINNAATYPFLKTIKVLIEYAYNWNEIFLLFNFNWQVEILFNNCKHNN